MNTINGGCHDVILDDMVTGQVQQSHQIAEIHNCLLQRNDCTKRTHNKIVPCIKVWLK
jgi:hypothetical protein